MNVKIINEGEFGSDVTIVTKSGNKIQGTIIRMNESNDMIKLKTNDGVIMINADAIESIY